MTKRVLVLGIGNLLLGDEGVGVRVVEAFEKAYELPDGVEALDGGTSGMDLLNQIAGIDHLIVTDAVRAGGEPGDIVRLVDDDVPAFFRNKMSPHQVGLADVLAAAHLTGEAPSNVTLIGIHPLDMDLGLDLSPTVAAQVDPAVAMVVDELRALGFSLVAR